MKSASTLPGGSMQRIKTKDLDSFKTVKVNYSEGIDTDDEIDVDSLYEWLSF